MGATVTRREQSASPTFTTRVARGPALLLDGATGTELERHGARSELPLWSARALLDAPALVERIHRDYVEAGAEVLTANTFRTQARTLSRAGVAASARELTRLAVALARRAADAAGSGPRAFVAGSMPPLEDCFHPERAPDDRALALEHAEHARHLRDAGVDLLLVETHGGAREARAATRAARETGLPVWTSFVCDGAGRLPSGETLEQALSLSVPLGPELIGVNCLAPEDALAVLPRLAALGRPFAVFANLGRPLADGSWRRSGPGAPEAFAEHASRWLAAGARAVGGCCGTTPAHVRAIAAALRTAARDRPDAAS
jgi:S-methylmethionine-dependent homocysteine/selenocysteine methylase